MSKLSQSTQFLFRALVFLLLLSACQSTPARNPDGSCPEAKKDCPSGQHANCSWIVDGCHKCVCEDDPSPRNPGYPTRPIYRPTTQSPLTPDPDNPYQRVGPGYEPPTTNPPPGQSE